MTKTVGIIGGMGPESTVELMRKVIRLTPTRREQDHIRMMVDNRPQIPDRTKHILGKGPSPLPLLKESAQLLEQWGADFLAMPCNTAHHFIDEIQSTVKIPLQNMLKILAETLEARYPAGTPVVLLATSGSLKIRLFDLYLAKFNLIIPDDEIQQDLVMKAIYGEKGIKAGGDLGANRGKIIKAIESLRSAAPACIIAGCTEVGLALEGASPGIPVLNPVDLLAEAIVREAAG